MKNEDSSGKVGIASHNNQKERSFFMNRITQDMQFRQSRMKYAEKYGVAKASRKYDKSASYICFWRSRWDGSVESLRPKSRRSHHHPKQHTEEELKLIRDLRRRNPKLGVVTLWHRLRKRGVYPARLLLIQSIASPGYALTSEREKEVRCQAV